MKCANEGKRGRKSCYPILHWNKIEFGLFDFIKSHGYLMSIVLNRKSSSNHIVFTFYYIRHTGPPLYFYTNVCYGICMYLYDRLRNIIYATIYIRNNWKNTFQNDWLLNEILINLTYVCSRDLTDFRTKYLYFE